MILDVRFLQILASFFSRQVFVRLIYIAIIGQYVDIVPLLMTHMLIEVLWFLISLWVLKKKGYRYRTFIAPYVRAIILGFLYIWLYSELAAYNQPSYMLELDLVWLMTNLLLLGASKLTRWGKLTWILVPIRLRVAESFDRLNEETQIQEIQGSRLREKCTIKDVFDVLNDMAGRIEPEISESYDILVPDEMECVLKTDLTPSREMKERSQKAWRLFRANVLIVEAMIFTYCAFLVLISCYVLECFILPIIGESYPLVTWGLIIWRAIFAISGVIRVIKLMRNGRVGRKEGAVRCAIVAIIGLLMILPSSESALDWPSLVVLLVTLGVTLLLMALCIWISRRYKETEIIRLDFLQVEKETQDAIMISPTEKFPWKRIEESDGFWLEIIRTRQEHNFCGPYAAQCIQSWKIFDRLVNGNTTGVSDKNFHE